MTTNRKVHVKACRMEGGTQNEPTKDESTFIEWSNRLKPSMKKRSLQEFILICQSGWLFELFCLEKQIYEKGNKIKNI